MTLKHPRTLDSSLPLLRLAVIVTLVTGISLNVVAEETLLGNVVDVLTERYYDREFRQREIPRIAEAFYEPAHMARTIKEQREVAHQFLENVPVSHLGLLSKPSYQRLLNELMGRKAPTWGFEIVELGGAYYVCAILEDGPAQRAGLLRGDRIVAVDGTATSESPQLDWRTDDAHLDDPARHVLLTSDEGTIGLLVERRPGESSRIEIQQSDYSALEAAYSSARIIDHEGVRVGYMHLWFVHLSGNQRLIDEKVNGTLAEAEAIVFDLRGRGGSATEVPGIISALERVSTDRPVIALIDGETRSAKEVISSQLRERKIATLVGETTAGAVIPATFTDVGFDTMLMFPSFTVPGLGVGIEGHGVEPDVVAIDSVAFAAGKDPILAAGLAEASRQVDRKRNTLETGFVSQSVASRDTP